MNISGLSRGITTFLILSITTVIVGCDETVDKMVDPKITQIGTFDGCNVKLVDRGTTFRSFYIARCDNKTTTTQNIPLKNIMDRRTTIVTE